MTEHLRAPGFPNQIVMLENPTVGFEFGARLEGENKMFMTQAHELGKIAVAGCGRGVSDEHEVILP